MTHDKAAHNTATHNTGPGSTPSNNDADLAVSAAASKRNLIGVIAVAALGLASAGIITSQLGSTDNSLTGSLNAVPSALEQALDEAEATRAPTEIIRLTSASADAADSDDSIIPSTDEVVDTVGDIASTVGNTLIEVGKCLLDQLPDVFSSSGDGTPTDAADASTCTDLLPTADDFGAIDLSVLDLADLDLTDIDLGDFDPADLGLPTDFDLRDVDLDELGSYELPDIADLDFEFNQIEFGNDVLDVVGNVADQVIEFFEELPGNLRDRFDGLFASD